MTDYRKVKDLHINFYMCDYMASIAITIDYFGTLTPQTVSGTLTGLNSNSGCGR